MPSWRSRRARRPATGYQLAIHAIGDAANAQVIARVRAAWTATIAGDRRWRLEHAQVLDVADLPRLAKAGIIASMQPTHQTSDRTMAEARLGPNRLGGAYAWQTLAQVGRAAGVRVGLPGRIAQPLPRPGRRGQPPGHERASRRADGGRRSGSASRQALDGFTRGAAYAGFAEDRIGSLDAGQAGRLHPRRPRCQHGRAGRAWRGRRCSRRGSRARRCGRAVG